MSVYFVDTESTGHFDEQPDCQVIELAYAPALPGGALGEIKEKRFKPTVPMTFGAMAVHHIIPSELESLTPFTPDEVPADAQLLVGHNIDFDYKMTGSRPGLKRICTLAMARTWWADEPGHSLGACLYRIRDHANAREYLRYAHSAATDVRICHEVFSFLLERFREKHKHPYSVWGDIWKLSENCRVPRKWNFGKHRGKRIGHELGEGRADLGYHTWFMRQIDGDQYVQRAISMYREGTL